MRNNSCSIAILVSGVGSNFQSILDHIQQGHINANIACIISNNPDAYSLVRAKQADIPIHVIERKNYTSRETFGQELIRILEAYSIRLIVLAGFMHVLSNTFIQAYPGRILNIHPSLLPKFPGLHTHQRALKADETEHGCSVHFVTANLDQGPLIIQAKVPVKTTDNAERLAARVLEKEHIIYPLAVKWFSQNKLSCSNNAIYFDNEPLSTHIILTAKHEAELR